MAAAATFGFCLWLVVAVKLPFLPTAEADRWVVSAAFASVMAGLVSACGAWWAARENQPGSADGGLDVAEQLITESPGGFLLGPRARVTARNITVVSSPPVQLPAEDEVGPPKSVTGPMAEAVKPWRTSKKVADWDALQLGVHPAITADVGKGQALPELTTYVRRAHDIQLRELLVAPSQPVMVVLVGGSSTGKTRAAFEAVQACLPDWSLLRPVDAAELVAQLASVPVSPRSVLWLNEAQVFLRDQPEAAAALRRLLAGGEPVMVVGTMWPRFWKDLTATPGVGELDVHYQARELLVHGTVRVEVPEVFAGANLAELRRQLGRDRRLSLGSHSAGRSSSAMAAITCSLVPRTRASGPSFGRLRDLGHRDDGQPRRGDLVSIQGAASVMH